MKKTQTPWEAIGAYLDNRSDKENEAIVKEWLKQSPKNVRQFKEIVDTRYLTQQKTDRYQPNTEKLWGELIERIQPVQKKSKRLLMPYLKYTAIAAAIVLAFLVGKIQHSGENANVGLSQLYSTLSTEPGERSHMMLPDGTKVWLNTDSELKYASDFNQEHRDVYVTGECYFEVAKNARKPFVVHANDLQVKVYGTHFNVKESSKTKQSEVTLVEGKVEVLSPENKSLSYLSPGEKLTLKGDKYRIDKAENPKVLIAWTQGVLVFVDQPFEEVVSYLENWYGVTIQLDQSLHNNHRFTFKVKTESLREVLELISVITPIQYNIDGEKVFIKSKRS
ncbi:FecR family protein [Mangrovibacterium diazotrophicum]|uniref:FecR family protein n=1 Tax=Mangrovibacterium diazotrophicum TaxID=1261403 RepID=A0A419W5F4_9BACT|nr:FecR family protein [Mangrovibacterium diazotrophicum]RKD90683.1 FecR family protein [Mangrovibacterium diazotrophicum]